MIQNLNYTSSMNYNRCCKYYVTKQLILICVYCSAIASEFIETLYVIVGQRNDQPIPNSSYHHWSQV